MVLFMLRMSFACAGQTAVCSPLALLSAPGSASCRPNRESASALPLALLGGVSSCCCCFWGCLLVLVLALLLLLLLAAPASLEAAKILSHVSRFGRQGRKHRMLLPMCYKGGPTHTATFSGLEKLCTTTTTTTRATATAKATATTSTSQRTLQSCGRAAT